MHDDLEQLKQEAISAISQSADEDALIVVETKYLGRKGALTEVLRTLGTLSPEEKKERGSAVNSLKLELEGAVLRRRSELKTASLGLLAEKEWIDVSAPGKEIATGHFHPMTRVIREITEIFSRLGYNRSRYPEVDWDWFAFEALNMPKEHPARDEWETFFVLGKDGVSPLTNVKLGKGVLTPHTSNGQVREMQRKELPIRMINITKCYRRESNVTHAPMFHQFEGLLIDKHISIAHLKGTLDYFARAFFGEGRVTRLRPFHFRFTEPSFEVDISCGVCGGSGKIDGVRCRVCKEGWHELGGAGMVHPNVLKAGGVDPETYGGFAFGFGVERSWMMRTGMHIDDIRILYKNDARFLEQF